MRDFLSVLILDKRAWSYEKNILSTKDPNFFKVIHHVELNDKISCPCKWDKFEKFLKYTIELKNGAPSFNAVVSFDLGPGKTIKHFWPKISNFLHNKCLTVLPRPKTLLSNIIEQRRHC